MASIWDRLKGLFGGASSGGARSPSPFESEAFKAVGTFVKNRKPLTAQMVAEEVMGTRLPSDGQKVAQARGLLDQLYEDGYFTSNDYGRSTDAKAGWIYHDVNVQPAAAPVAKVVSTAPAPTTAKPAPAAPIASPPGPSAWTAAPATPRAAPTVSTPFRAPQPTAPAASAPYRTAQDPYAASGILSLSADEVRARSLKIDPYRTAWIGRTDTIPPQSDERTALIDRGLVLRGLIDEKQLAEIHRVGDLWIQYHDAARLIEAAAHRAGSDAAAKLAAEKKAKKEQKKREALERARRHREDVAHRRATDVVYLGRGVSSRLGDRRSNVEALRERGLPVLSSPADVSVALGITVPRLRWLCFHADAAEKTHYVYFSVPKRSGGTRLLAAPHKELGRAQQWVLDQVLAKLPVEPDAHGFVPGRSTATNAKPHVGADVVVNQDLSDFFPTITFARVRGVFARLGYSPAVATVLALLCTEAPRTRVEYAGRPYQVAVGPRALPQGACTSPALSNQVARKLDRRLRGMCAKHGWTYTRYADDLTFSAPEGRRDQIGMLLARVRHVVTDEGFAINPKKGRVQRAARRQSVTGIVVNDKPGLPREQVRRLRAILHGAKKTGLAAQNREGRSDFASWLRGHLAYLAMVDPDKGRAMLGELDAIEARGA